MALDLTGLTNEVKNTEGVEASAVALINGFAAAVDAANTANSVAIKAVTDRMRASATVLAAAVAAGPTGGTTPPVVVPPVVTGP